jgi:hypothetical protein
LFFVSVFVFAAKIDDLGSRGGNAVQALTQWLHPVASSKAWDVLHRAMRPALYRPIRMVIKVASNFPAFFVIVDFLFAHNHR